MSEKKPHNFVATHSSSHAPNSHKDDQEQAYTPDSQDEEWPWLSIQSFSEYTNGEISEWQIRWLLRSRHQNGLDEDVITIGKKLYLHKHRAARKIAAISKS